MNDSTSAISPVWPTRWPKDSFKGFWTWLLAGFIARSCSGCSSCSQLLVPPPKNVYAGTAKRRADRLSSSLDGSPRRDRTAGASAPLEVQPSRARIPRADLGNDRHRDSSARSRWSSWRTARRFADRPSWRTASISKTSSRSLKDFTTPRPSGSSPFLQSSSRRSQRRRCSGSSSSISACVTADFWTGAIVSGVLFGIAHGDLFAGVPLALGGIVLCGVYYLTRNAFASMISHALFNSFSIVMLLMFPKLTQ